MTKKLRAVIIGSGNIGANKPDHIDRPDGPNILTHAHGYQANPQTELVGFVDIDFDKLSMATYKWGRNIPILHGKNMNQVLDKMKPDIITISACTSVQLQVIEELLKGKGPRPKVILHEKPMGMNTTEAKKIATICKKENIIITVNYTRRYDPDHRNIAQKLKGKQIYHSRLVYGRGLRRDGCHAVDLAHWLFGKRLNTKATDPLKAEHHGEVTPCISQTLAFEHCPRVSFEWIDSNHFSIFEYDLFYEGGHIRFYRNGMMYEEGEVKAEDELGKYKALYPDPEAPRNTSLVPFLIARPIEHAIRLAQGKETKPYCSAEDAVRVHETMEFMLGDKGEFNYA